MDNDIEATARVLKKIDSEINKAAELLTNMASAIEALEVRASLIIDSELLSSKNIKIISQ
ncbi:MAG: hypothetical protein HN733_00480 [Gammaproteobacteria bacterium]|jgi:hypothetical protein|nr:hypothetical protein [Gammaproteobacteria bacterium]